MQCKGTYFIRDIQENGLPDDENLSTIVLKKLKYLPS
jgi:hypothetical protein